MTGLQAGTVVTLDVEREAPFGFFLTNGEEDVLLHDSEVSEDFDPDQPQTVFLFQDHQGRLAATMTIPTVQMGKYDWVDVVEVKESLGVFVSIGISKDILVSKDDLPALLHLWPAIGDRLYCSLKTDRHGRLFAKLATEDTMRAIAENATRKDFNKNVTGWAYRLLKIGTFLLTEENYIGFIHETQRKQEPRLGQKVEGRIVDVKEDGTINVSLLSRGHEAMDEDSMQIFTYMQSRGGKMPYWDKSAPEDITARFDMSKAAFKRALGRLMKEGKVFQEDGWSYIKE
ncbi:CvfB family protein [Heyndrickxia sp. NPDC080065]|uniref:CvfB family protein n=1 Tax=Heyndrickxia sp. NPDC080065 TaxID=3390568 RepID=UPI003CFEF9FE